MARRSSSPCSRTTRVRRQPWIMRSTELSNASPGFRGNRFPTPSVKDDAGGRSPEVELIECQGTSRFDLACLEPVSLEIAQVSAHGEVVAQESDGSPAKVQSKIRR